MMKIASNPKIILSYCSLHTAQIYTLLGPRAVMNIAQAFKIKLRNFFSSLLLTQKKDQEN